jgi:AbrB family looped-hinge helix DNA binding protein
MNTVTVSAKFQVVIPRRIREALGIRPGQKLQAFQYGNRIELVPVRPLLEARGLFAGIETDVEREPVEEHFHAGHDHPGVLSAACRSQ